jgi:hypothetical protein
VICVRRSDLPTVKTGTRNGLSRRQPSKRDLFGAVMMACGARVVKRGCHVGCDVRPVLPTIVVDGAESMQRCERVMYEAGERVKLGRLTGDEVTFEVGSKSVHRPPTAQAASTKPDEDTDKSVSMSNGVVSAADETLDGTRTAISELAASVDRSNAFVDAAAPGPLHRQVLSKNEQRKRGETAYALFMASPHTTAPSCPHCRGTALRNTRPSRSGCYRICSGCNYMWHVTGEALRAENAPLPSRRRTTPVPLS